MKSWVNARLSLQVALGFTMMSAALAVGGAIGIWSSRAVSLSLGAAFEEQAGSFAQALHVDEAMFDALATERAILLADQNGDAASAQRLRARYQETLAGLRGGSRAGSASQAGEVARARDEWLAASARVVSPAADGDGRRRAAEQSLSESQTRFEALRARQDAQHEVELGAVRDARASADRQYRGLVIFMSIATFFAVLMGVGFAWSITTRATGPIRVGVEALIGSAEQMRLVSAEVSASAQSLSQGATEQAASLEETSASMEQMASMTRKNAENAHRAAELVTETHRLVRDSNTALDGMVSSMASISASSGQISRIIKTIDEIAFQTNILALNAAVEAARAGESGAGFAVVADEVRGLAQRSAQAARDTAQLIDDAIARSKEGNDRVRQMASSIAAITESSANVKELVDAISEASRQQSAGIDQVAKAIAQMERVTQTSAANTEQSAAAGDELSAQAQSTMAVVRQLDALVGGRKTAAGAGDGRPVPPVPVQTGGEKIAGQVAVPRPTHPTAAVVPFGRKGPRRGAGNPAPRGSTDETVTPRASHS